MCYKERLWGEKTLELTLDYSTSMLEKCVQGKVEVLHGGQLLFLSQEAIDRLYRPDTIL